MGTSLRSSPKVIPRGTPATPGTTDIRSGSSSSSTAWRKGTDQEARLGIPGNSHDLVFLADGWPAPERPAVQEEDIVPPGGTATFSFRVKGAAPGIFVVPLRGVVDGGAWMDDMGMFTVVTVR